MRARQPSPRHTRTRMVISVGVVAALLLPACGSDDDATPATEPTTSVEPSTTTTAAPPTTETTTTTAPTATTVAPTATSAPTTTTVVSDGPTLLRYGDDGIVLVAAGTETRIVDGPIAWAASDRAGGVVFTRQGDGTDWGRREISTWWLPAGTAEPSMIEMSGVPDTDPNGAPVLVGRPSTSVDEWCEAEQSPLIRHALATGEDTVISCRDEMGDVWFWITSAGGGRTALTGGSDVLNISYAGEVLVLDAEGDELDLPGNPYGTCPEISEPWMCDVHGLLSPDGRLIATWYRPDHVMAMAWDDAPPEWADLHTQWLARLGTVPATIRVLELDSGRELFTTEVSAQTRLADFDGRFVVVAPREYTDDQFWTDIRNAPWTVLDTIGGDEPVTVDGPVGLRVMGGSR